MSGSTAGFAAPDVLFAGNSATQERRYYRVILERLRGAGYTRYAEVGCGSFAAALVAVSAGWNPQQMETSDITLYSSILGTVLSGGDLAALDVRLDGEPVELPGTGPAGQAAFLLWLQLRARIEARPDSEYWRNIIDDLSDRATDHQAKIARQVAGLMERLHGLSYRPMDMWAHMGEVLDDPHAVILSAPPTYSAGFEKFFDTDGRLTWAEPDYEVFEPATGFADLVELTANRAALSLCLQEGQTGKAAHYEPVFARPNGPGRTCYVLASRPDEVKELMGGIKVVLRLSGEIEPSSYPPLDFDWQPGERSVVTVAPVKSAVADYYRGLWMHRLNAIPGPGNMLVILDGKAAGIIGYSFETIVRPHSIKSRWRNHMLLRFAIGAPHESLRLTRLATMLALQKQTCRAAFGPGSLIFFGASVGLVTVEYTRKDEAKGLRGLMKIACPPGCQHTPHAPGCGKLPRRDGQDGYQLFYSALWQDRTPVEVLAEWLRKEAASARARARAAS